MMEQKWLNPDIQLGMTTCEGLALENFRRIKLMGIGSNPVKNYATDRLENGTAHVLSVGEVQLS